MCAVCVVCARAFCVLTVCVVCALCVTCALCVQYCVYVQCVHCVCAVCARGACFGDARISKENVLPESSHDMSRNVLVCFIHGGSSQPKIGDFRRVVVLKQDVARLEVPVYDTRARVLVQVGQTPG